MYCSDKMVFHLKKPLTILQEQDILFGAALFYYWENIWRLLLFIVGSIYFCSNLKQVYYYVSGTEINYRKRLGEQGFIK